MYVEMSQSMDNHLTLCSILEHCSSLRKLHYHEMTFGGTVGTSAYSVLESYHYGTAGKFETFTFTDDRRTVVAHETGRTEPVDAYGLAPAPESVFGLFKASLRICPSVVVRNNPRPSTNSVVLDRRTPHLVQRDFSNIFIVIKDDVPATLEAAARYHLHPNTRALTLKCSPLETAAQMCSASSNDALIFLRFLRGCINLRELNLAGFHFEANFECCSVLADAGLIRLRALTLPSCALRHRGHFEQLARAPFRLQELDVRGALNARPLTCVFCNEPSTCTEEVFEGLRQLCPLRSLTLCDLPHIRNLHFLRGCVFRELRLRNLGLGKYATQETIAALAEVMQQLESLKLESRAIPLDLSLLTRGPRNAPRLRRLCVASAGIAAGQSPRLMRDLCRLFPATESVHVHSWIPGVAWEPLSVIVPPLFSPDGGCLKLYMESAYSADRSVLCETHDYVSVPRPHNCGPRRF
ncbi:hypothetical protein V5799_018195 [Amblyomma americanum]|uniref:Uncharacterized protein n=1 Tax=Amblyomma americanum TaxID=6943 RepID=A0AAQ4EZX8_AMBAM